MSRVQLLPCLAVLDYHRSRINKLLDVPELAPDDPFPSHVCQACKRRIVSLEKATANITSFKELARSSLRRSLESRGTNSLASPAQLFFVPPKKKKSWAGDARLGHEHILAIKYSSDSQLLLFLQQQLG